MARATQGPDTVSLTAIAMVARDALPEARAIRGAVEVASLAEVRAALLMRVSPGPTSLDLYAHTTRGHHHLRLGGDAIDLLEPRIAAWSAALVADGVLARAGVVQVRLLGCSSAVGPAARASLARLVGLTGGVVVGTRAPLFAAHHGPTGLRPDCAHLLERFTPTTWAARPVPHALAGSSRV